MLKHITKYTDKQEQKKSLCMTKKNKNDKKEQSFMQRIVFVLSFLSEALANDMCEKCLLMNKKRRELKRKNKLFC